MTGYLDLGRGFLLDDLSSALYMADAPEVDRVSSFLTIFLFFCSFFWVVVLLVYGLGR